VALVARPVPVALVALASPVAVRPSRSVRSLARAVMVALVDPVVRLLRAWLEMVARPVPVARAVSVARATAALVV